MNIETIWKSILLGTVQGLTEFLPVSSSGHLSLLQRVLGYELGGAGMTFVNVMFHLGTLLPVFWIFRKEILALFKKPFKTLLMLIAATVPAGLVGILFNDKIDALFAGDRGIAALAVCFAFTALLLLVCEYLAKKKRREAPLGWRQAGAMGLMQAVALFPGISRSGSTVFAGTASGAGREEVARFSFLMSIPVILGSAVVEAKDVVFPEAGMELSLGGAEIAGMLLGVAFAALAGFIAVKVMIKVIKQANYKWFSLYLMLLSAVCLWLDVAQIF